MTSPLMIQIAMHYWTRPGPYAANEPEHRESVAVIGIHEQFVNGGLLRKLEEPDRYGGSYEATEAMEVWIKGLTSVPWPVQEWVIPKQVGGHQ